MAGEVGRQRGRIHPATADRVARWSAEPEVAGVILVGSKSRGHDDERSDDDLEVVVTDACFDALGPRDYVVVGMQKQGSVRRLVWDAKVLALRHLVDRAASPYDSDHWQYEQARVLADREGDVSLAVDAARRMSPEFRHARLCHGRLDLGTAISRADRALRRSSPAAARLITTRGCRALARLLFALEWRWVPVDHWIERELATLAGPTPAADLLVDALLVGTTEPLKAALAELQPLLAAEAVPDRDALYYRLCHPDRAAERALHALR